MQYTRYTTGRASSLLVYVVYSEKMAYTRGTPYRSRAVYPVYLVYSKNKGWKAFSRGGTRMWLTDLLPAQSEFTAEVAPDNAVTANDPTSQPKPGACRKRLTSPSQAGAIDWETLAAWKDEFPHMRPCPKAKNNFGDWPWVNRSQCRGCPWAVTEEARTLQ